METTTPLRPSEFSKIANITKPNLSRLLKDADDENVTRVNKRVIGLSPNLVEFLLSKHCPDMFKTAITLIQGTTGGIGKTSGTISLAYASRRITSLDKPIILIDCDSQASLTLQICGSATDDFALIDYFEGRASLSEVLVCVSKQENIWLIKSNLNNIYLDKHLNKPSIIKNCMRDLFDALIEHFGEGSRIFLDFPPQLSSIFSSSVIGLAQLNNATTIKTLASPIRSDLFGIRGTEITIEEVYEILETFNLSTDMINIVCYFSMFDRRIQATSEIFKRVMANPIIQPHLCPLVIRYSSELTKASLKNKNIFSTKNKTTISDDYTDLLLNLYGYKGLEQ